MALGDRRSDGGPDDLDALAAEDLNWGQRGRSTTSSMNLRSARYRNEMTNGDAPRLERRARDSRECSARTGRLPRRSGLRTPHGRDRRERSWSALTPAFGARRPSSAWRQAGFTTRSPSAAPTRASRRRSARSPRASGWRAPGRTRSPQARPPFRRPACLARIRLPRARLRSPRHERSSDGQIRREPVPTVARFGGSTPLIAEERWIEVYCDGDEEVELPVAALKPKTVVTMPITATATPKRKALCAP